jgi:LCP family protein required for cell wall assembly
VRSSHKRFAASGRANGDGKLALPPEPIARITYYDVFPKRRSGLTRVLRGAVWLALVLIGVALGGVGGAFLWLDESIGALQAHSPAVKRAQKQLAVPLPGRPAIALLLGDNQRAGPESSAGGRSDTIMLIRADPATKTISLLSIPRDLRVPVYCPGSSVPRATTRVDYAFAWCGPAGSLDTIRRLTRLPINYLITVDFHGFKKIVDDLGGVWLDIDRRYYNHNVGTAATDYSNIDLQPGYQRLSGGSALQFVRFRHTDSDFYRVARQQEFLHALKNQVARNFDPLELPALVSDIVHNVEVGSNHSFSVSTVIGYALFAATLPHGHLLQDYLGRNQVADVNVGGADELQASPLAIQRAVERFVNPDVGASRAANDAALGTKPQSPAAPSPRNTSVTVLNGNGVAGAAATASYLLTKRGYKVVLPPGGIAPNAPTDAYFHTAVYYNPHRSGAQAAAAAIARLFVPADLHEFPTDRALLALNPGATVMVVVGQTFHNAITPSQPRSSPRHTSPVTRFDPAPGLDLMRPFVHRVPFQIETPTLLERRSQPDTLPGDTPARLYWIDRTHRAIRLVLVTASREFWGIEETDLPDPPILDDRSFTHHLRGRTYQLYYAGNQLHMVVFREGNATYWVVNTLLNSLSNETMLAIAEGLKPISAGR